MQHPFRDSAVRRHRENLHTRDVLLDAGRGRAYVRVRGLREVELVMYGQRRAEAEIIIDGELAVHPAVALGNNLPESREPEHGKGAPAPTEAPHGEGAVGVDAAAEVVDAKGGEARPDASDAPQTWVVYFGHARLEGRRESFFQATNQTPPFSIQFCKVLLKIISQLYLF